MPLLARLIREGISKNSKAYFTTDGSSRFAALRNLTIRRALAPKLLKQRPIPAIAVQIQRDLFSGRQRHRVIRIGIAQYIRPALVEPVPFFKPHDSRPALAFGVN